MPPTHPTLLQLAVQGRRWLGVMPPVGQNRAAGHGAAIALRNAAPAAGLGGEELHLALAAIEQAHDLRHAGDSGQVGDSSVVHGSQQPVGRSW